MDLLDFKVLISKEQIENRLSELAKEIEKDYEGKEITVVCVMRGACFFTVNLTLKIKNSIKYEFIELSSYEDKTESSGKVRIVNDLRNSIEGKDVLVIEDIIDTGRTMDFLVKYLKHKKPNSVKICTLADKPERRVIDINADYIGFTVPNKFIIGYGFDVDNKYRNLPYIAYLDE